MSITTSKKNRAITVVSVESLPGLSECNKFQEHVSQIKQFEDKIKSDEYWSQLEEESQILMKNMQQ